MKVVFESCDGSTHATEEACRLHEAQREGLKYKCTKCNGKSTINGNPITKIVVDDNSGLFSRLFRLTIYKTITVGYERIPCNACSGKGFTEINKAKTQDNSTSTSGTKSVNDTGVFGIPVTGDKVLDDVIISMGMSGMFD